MSSSAVKPLTRTIDEAERLIVRLNAGAERLAEAISYEQTLHWFLTTAQEELETAESEVIHAAMLQAQNKLGPLHGIAPTSKAYDHAVKTLLGQRHQDALSHLYDEVQHLGMEYCNAQIDRAQAETHFAAIKQAADLKVMILRAASL